MVGETPRGLAQRGITKALVVTDKVLVANGVAGRVTGRFDAAGVVYTVYDAVMPNPSIEAVQAGVAAFASSGADCLIAIGGGSPGPRTRPCRSSRSRRRRAPPRR